MASSVSGMDESKKPLWRYTSNVVKLPGPGGNRSWDCNYCGINFKSSYTRVKAHLLQTKKAGIDTCSKVTADNIFEMRKLEEEAVKRQQPYTVSLPSSTSTLPNAPPLPVSNYDGSKKRKGNHTLVDSFNIQHRNQLDEEIARMFYTAGLPFNLARNPHFINAFTFAANHNLGGYVPPGYNKLRTSLLQQEKAHVERLLEPIKSTWGEKGVTIVSDGWSDPQRRPIINFMVVSDSGPMFIKSVDSSGVIKDKHFIAEKLEEVINEVGDHKVVQVITDNAANCKAAGEIIAGKYPSIYWTPCVVHTLNLALKNICAAKNVECNQEVYAECNWITQLHDEVMFIKNFIMNHQMRLAIFGRFSSLKLLAVADTRFASVVVMMKRFKLLKCSLETMVMSSEWNEYKEDDRRAAQTVREWVVSESWWEKIDYILAFTTPIYDMLRACDTDKPCLHLVYEMWDSMIEKVRKVIDSHEAVLLDESSSFYDVIRSILVARWTKNNTPLHCLAHSLNPRYYSDQWLREEEGRQSPNSDDEVCEERRKCFKRLFPNNEERQDIIAEYGIFTLKKGSFSDPDAIASMYKLDPQVWWSCYGSSAQTLQKLAFRLLGQPSSSSCYERNWSTYSVIHSLRRNKLTPRRAQDLVFVHNNLRLLSRNRPEYQGKNTKMWDVGGDDFGSMEDVGYLEIASLTLDEPELETVLCEDDVIAEEE